MSEQIPIYRTHYAVDVVYHDDGTTVDVGVYKNGNLIWVLEDQINEQTALDAASDFIAEQIQLEDTALE